MRTIVKSGGRKKKRFRLYLKKVGGLGAGREKPKRRGAGDGSGKGIGRI